MTIQEAVIKRLQEICSQKKKSVSEISLKGGMSPSNIYDLLHNRTKHSKINTIHKFCEGADISLAYFFNSKFFENLEDED